MPQSITPARDPNHAYYQRLCALLEPDALEYPRWGTFTYAVGSSETKYLMLALDTYIDPNASARYDVRLPNDPLPLRDVTIKGAGSGSGAVFLNPAAVSYLNARKTYSDRLAEIAALKTKYVYGSSSTMLFLPGPYGSIITSSMTFDNTAIGLAMNGVASGVFPIDNSLGSTTVRFQHTMTLPITKAITFGMNSPSGGTARSLLSFVDVPSSWGRVADGLAPYDFRDDFMGASLDTTTVWNRTQSTAGNVEIDSMFAWCKLIGNASYGNNGLISQTSVARSGQPVLLFDICPSTNAAIVIGWHDGAGLATSDLAHGLVFNSGGFNVYENGTDRGAVGSGYTAGLIYRVRITALSGGGATYEIQGGTQYNTIGSGSWSSLTPGTSSSATNTLYAGATVSSAGVSYLGDVRVY